MKRIKNGSTGGTLGTILTLIQVASMALDLHERWTKSWRRKEDDDRDDEEG